MYRYYDECRCKYCGGTFGRHWTGCRKLRGLK